MIDPDKGEALWGKIVVSGMKSPGQVRLSGPGLVVGWDIVNPTATFGGTTTRTNEPIKEFEAEFYLVNEPGENGLSDFDDWDPFERLLRKSFARRDKTIALSVSHPDLARIGITAATIKSIGMMMLDGKGGATIKVAFIEYRPPKKVTYPQTSTKGDSEIDERLGIIKQKNVEFDILTGWRKP